MARAGIPTSRVISSRRWSILYIRKCPPRGGDTLFANMYAAYEALNERMKTYLEGLTARHDGEHYRGQYANYGIKDKESYPFADHPIVRTHPVTGRKALYVNEGFTRYINGIPRDESHRHPAISLQAYGEFAVPMPLPLAGELDRLLGQSLRPASRDVGLLAAHPFRPPGNGQGRPAGLEPLLPHQLLFGLLGEMFELKADAGGGHRRILGAEIGGDLLNDVPVTAGLELSPDNPLYIGLGGVAEQPQALCRPQALTAGCGARSL